MMSWTCSGCGEAIEASFDACWSCGTDRAGKPPDREAWDAATAGHIVDADPVPPLLPMTTTPRFEGSAIAEYKGIVTGEAILGANVLSDTAAGVRDVVGGRSRSYERKLASARRQAFSGMSLAARATGANAVVGVSLDHEAVRGSMLMVVATGTAVVTASHESG